MDWRLSQKGLFLVGSLLVFELFFIGTLMHLQDEVERQGNLEEHSKEVVGKTNGIFQLIYDAGSSADRFLKSENQQDQQLFQRETAELALKLQELKPMLADQPVHLEKVKAVERDSARGFGLLGALMEQVGREGHDAAAISELSHIKELRRLQKQVLSDLRWLMQEQEKLVKNSFAQRIESTHSVRNWMLIGVILNIVAAVGAALFFIKGVTSRLQVLVDNTIRLGNGVPLKPPLGGSDEIALLDKTFHDMSDRLAEASRQRREMVAMINHDMRTPLNAVEGFLSLLSRGAYGEVSDALLSRSQMSEDSIARLIRLINDLLDLEQIESGKLTLQPNLVSSENLVKRSLESVRVLAEQKDIHIEAPSQHFDLFADEDRAIRVLVNLLSNAIKFSDKGKSIVLSTALVDDQIEFAVSDQGCGISPSDQATLFVAFQQLRSREDNAEGSGLGLAICKSITEQHGGSIGVTSNEGEGSRFWFRLPVSAR